VDTINALSLGIQVVAVLYGIGIVRRLCNKTQEAQSNKSCSLERVTG
jgi:hypothetical protein